MMIVAEHGGCGRCFLGGPLILLRGAESSRAGSIDDRAIRSVYSIGRYSRLRLGRIRALSGGRDAGSIRRNRRAVLRVVPEHSTQLAELVGIGRGVDLILYIWVCLSLIVVPNLHLKLRTQMELITVLARKLALADAQAPGATGQANAREAHPDASVARIP